MKGIIVDTPTGELKIIDDGLPFPVYTPIDRPEGIDLVVLKAKLAEMDNLKARIEKLEVK